MELCHHASPWLQGWGFLEFFGEIRLEICAPFPRVGNRPRRACHSFPITVKSATCQGRACSSTMEERELVPVALISPVLAECSENDLPCGGKVVFLGESVEVMQAGERRHP